IAGSGGSVAPASGYFNSGQSLSISANPNSGFSFSGWSGTGTGSFSGSNNPATITVNGPISEAAGFTPISNVQVTVQSNPAGRTFTVDGASFTTTQSFNWAPGSSHTISTITPQSGGTGVQYVWNGWSDGGAVSHTIVPTTNTNYTVSFSTQYFLTMTARAGGTVSSASGYFNSGESVNISAFFNSGFGFSGWV